MRFGIGAAKVAMMLVSPSLVLTVFVDVADAKERYCRQEYCAKRGPTRCTGALSWATCGAPKVGKCLVTGVRLVKC